MTALWSEVFRKDPAAAAAEVDVDEDLYGGFVPQADRRTLESLRTAQPEHLCTAQPVFEDARLATLLFRYRARNFPDSLHEHEAQAWEQHRAARLFDDERAEAILGALYDYAEAIAPERG
jgi:exodeoxyribonuclease-1